MKILLLKLRPLFLCCLLLPATACAPAALRPEAADLAAKPAAYQDGYEDGCNSGFVAAGSLRHNFRQAEPRFKKEDDYRQGWMDAYGACKKSLREHCRQAGRMAFYCAGPRHADRD